MQTVVDQRVQELSARFLQPRSRTIQPVVARVPARKRSIDPDDNSGAALREMLIRNTGPKFNQPPVGTALVHFGEAMVIWKAWQHTDSDLAQRLSINCALKDLAWRTANAIPAPSTVVGTFVEVDVILHVKECGAASELQIGTVDEPMCDAMWLGLWLVAGQRIDTSISLTPNALLPHEQIDDEHVLRAGEALVSSASRARVKWQKDAAAANTGYLIFAELHVYRLARVAG